MLNSLQRLSSKQQGLVLVVLSSVALILLGLRSVFVPARNALVEPTPPYPPLTGQAFITTLGTSKDDECLWNQPEHIDRYQTSVGCKPHGTPVEILQHIWIRGAGEQAGCYCYLVRVHDDALGGWVGGYALSQDLAGLPQERCPWQPASQQPDSQQPDSQQPDPTPAPEP